MSTMLKERRALAKLREELEGRKGKLCRSCKKFRHLARNCRSKRGETKETVILWNKFEVLKSRVMQCGVEERAVRNMRTVVVKCFKCGEERHKCRKCPVWIRRKNEERAACVARPQKVQQEKRPAHPVKGKAQEGERRLRRVEGRGAARVAKPREAQQEEWRKSSEEVLRKRAEEHCGKGVPEEA